MSQVPVMPLYFSFCRTSQAQAYEPSTQHDVLWRKVWCGWEPDDSWHLREVCEHHQRDKLCCNLHQEPTLQGRPCQGDVWTRERSSETRCHLREAERGVWKKWHRCGIHGENFDNFILRPNTVPTPRLKSNSRVKSDVILNIHPTPTLLLNNEVRSECSIWLQSQFHSLW